LELGYENAPVQQYPKAGAGPKDWNVGEEKDKNGRDKEQQRENSKVKNRTNIKDLQAKQQR